MQSDLNNPDAIPWFLWDDPMTVGEVRRYLSTAPLEDQDRLLGKILREARDTDVWCFTTPAEVAARWQRLAPYLGRRRAFWRWLLDTWVELGILQNA